MPLSTYTNFGGGLNDTTVGDFVLDGGDNTATMYAHRCQNVYTGTEGLIKTHGFRAVFDDPLNETPQGIFDYKGELLGAWDGKLYRIDTIAKTRTLIHSDMDDEARVQVMEWVNRLVIMNGVDKPRVYDGSTVSIMPVVEDSSQLWFDARPQGMAVFRNRAFYWGDPDNPDTLYTPRPETLANFDGGDGTADAIAIAPGHGGKIMGVVPLTDDMLVIYKEKAIYSLRGNAPVGAGGGEPFRVNLITSELGCISTDTIVAIGTEHYFMSQVGLRKLSTTDKFGAVEPQQPHYTISKLVESFAFDEDIMKKAVATYVPSENSIYLSVYKAGKPPDNIYDAGYFDDAVFDYEHTGLTLVHHLITGANTLRTGWTPAFMHVFKRNMYHQNLAGNLYRHDKEAFSYDGAAYPSTWESKWIAHGGLMPLKRYRRVSIAIDPGAECTLTAKWYLLGTDRKTGASVESLQMNGGALWDTAVWNTSQWGDGGTQTFDITNLGKGHALKLVLSCNRAGEHVTIRTIDVEYELISTRRG